MMPAKAASITFILVTGVYITCIAVFSYIIVIRHDFNRLDIG